jgi:predicted small lipoprotein YifL
MTKAIILTLLMGVSLAACGNKVELRPRANAPAPVVAAGSAKPESPAKQTTPDAEAIPARSDELLKRSEERPTDEFDLPPPG